MRAAFLGIVFLGSVLFAAAASAAPSVYGSTGQINNPSADVLEQGQFAVGYYHLKDGGDGVFNMNLVTNVEVGVAGFRFDNSRDNNTMINAKWNLSPESVLTPGIAVGIEDIGNSTQRSAYAVVSKQLPFGYRVHVGVGDGRYNGGFASIEKTLNPISVLAKNNTFPATTLIAEYDGRNMNYGARMSIVNGLNLDAGWRDHQLYFGMSFSS